MVMPVDRKGHWASVLEPTVGQILNASDNPNANANAEGRAVFSKNTSALNITPYGTDIFYKLGNSTVVANTTTSHLLRGNVTATISVGEHTHLQVRRVGASNVTVYVSEFE